MLENAMRLCEASHCHIWRFDGKLLYAVAVRGDPWFTEWLQEHDPIVSQVIFDTSVVTCARAAETTSNTNIDPSRRGFSSDIVLSKQIRCRLVAGRK
jgi:hypothetical protein